ncbi:MAG: ubiquinone/menaquinone biosynthesis methyltransferase [Bacteroidales bacterium]|nr:ubiquinone/menaquinone biosynthesis methyltransferase [Bacteroidales bacterium]
MKDSRPLYKIFSSVPPGYDLINRLFTLRRDERWRRKTALLILEDNPQRIMDLCTGTGDLAMHIAGIAKAGVEITGFDYSRPMLDIAEQKAQKSHAGKIGFVLGDAAEMPFTDGYFDAIGIAFAFRNLTYKNSDSEKFLAEIFRVLRPGGKFVIVESSQPANRLLRFLFHTYTKTMVYYLGSWISGNKTAYRYLANSVIDYFTPVEVRVLLQKSGFAEVRHIPLMGGVAAIHVANKK